MLYFCIALKGDVRNNPETGKFGNLGNFLKIHRKKDQNSLTAYDAHRTQRNTCIAF